jgi:hypothetical protein
MTRTVFELARNRQEPVVNAGKPCQYTVNMGLEPPAEYDPHFLPLLVELQRELKELEEGSFTSMADDELLEKIRFLHRGFTFQAPIFPEGTLIYRAVRISQRPEHKSRVGYPPLSAVRSDGRLNKSGEVMFYGALNQFASCLQECSWQIGEFFAISAWLTTKRMTFNHLGYSAAVLEKLKSNRDLPFFAKTQQDSERNVLIREWQARVFTQQVAAGQEKLYRLPIALKEFALSRMVQTEPHAANIFSGVIYPSVAMWLLADNIAILTSEVDSKMALFEVILLTLDSLTKVQQPDGSVSTNFAMKPYDFARPDPEGNLIWGQKSQVIYPSGTDASRFTPQLLAPGKMHLE